MVLFFSFFFKFFFFFRLLIFRKSPQNEVGDGLKIIIKIMQNCIDIKGSLVDCYNH